MCSPKLEVGPEQLRTLFFRHVVLPVLHQLAWGEALAYIPEVVAYEPHPLLRNAHLMTFLAAFWPRRLARLPWSTERLFEVERSEEHTSELQSRLHLVCRLLLEKKKQLSAP